MDSYGDLDGAKEGSRVNDAFVIKAAKELGAKIQIGGGIRTEADIANYLENGVERVILGSAAVSDPAFTKEMIRKYGSRLPLGLMRRMAESQRMAGCKHLKR